ncbi:MAG: molybdate ABC transporter substrate-binding protein [Desulfobacterales bacterium]|nr:molybdate ABC transporter substrate-binding protein [Desulfobacterales bacterium]
MRLVLFLGVLMAPLIASGATAGAASEQITVFAAASTTDVVTQVGRLFGDRKLGAVVTSFAASSTLAKQIENGAPADIFISADLEWMDYLEKKKHIESATRANLLGNRIVLIAPAQSVIGTVTLGPGFDLAGLLGEGRLAMGDPSHVPAGRYARTALETMGVWPSVQSKVAGSATVRAALALVERGETPLGVVYATDAAISKKVKIVATFSQESHPAIVYPVAVVAGRQSEVTTRFISFLRSAEAKAVFEQAGFVVQP